MSHSFLKESHKGNWWNLSHAKGYAKRIQHDSPYVPVPYFIVSFYFTDSCTIFQLIHFFLYWIWSGDEEAKDNTTLQFDLKVKCIKNKGAPKNATDPDELFIHSKGDFRELFFFARTIHLIFLSPVSCFCTVDFCGWRRITEIPYSIAFLQILKSMVRLNSRKSLSVS